MQWLNAPQDPQGLFLLSDTGVVIGKVTSFTPSVEDEGRGYTHQAIWYAPGFSHPEVINAIAAGSIEECMTELERFWSRPGMRYAV